MAKLPDRLAGGGELETLALEKVAECSAAIAAAESAGEVVCALHSLAALLFPVDSAAVAGVVDERYRSKIINAPSLTDVERNSWKRAFYQGPAFPTMSKILLCNVASKWSAQFHASARKEVYDSFFLLGPSTEIILALVPVLAQKGGYEGDLNVIFSNIERLLILCLLENEGVRQMVREFINIDKHDDGILKTDGGTFISRVAQLLASIPDKARVGTTSALSSSSFFKRVANQLLVGAEERATKLVGTKDATDQDALDSAFLFVGETFSRICRRGSTGILVAELIPWIRNHLQNYLSPDSKAIISDMIGNVSQSQFWFNMIEAIRDQHSVERLTEEMLRQLASQDVSDKEAYWILWILFNRSFKCITATRAMFIEKFLLWKTFPLCCLRWILQYAVFECPPNSIAETEMQKTTNSFSTLQHLVSIWSKHEFVQSSSMEQQACIL